jgi:hypothetical protein
VLQVGSLKLSAEPDLRREDDLYLYTLPTGLICRGMDLRSGERNRQDEALLPVGVGQAETRFSVRGLYSSLR